MFQRKRGDTKVGSIEATYEVDLNARDDMLLRNLLKRRGFDSLSQLLLAQRGGLTTHARRRRVFLSFHAEDLKQVSAFRLIAKNPRMELEFYDASVREAIASERGAYIKSVIRAKIEAASVVVCLIGNGTAWREWVDWELRTAHQLRKGICGVRLKNSRGRRPPVLVALGAPVARWEFGSIVAAIEQAAASRS